MKVLTFLAGTSALLGDYLVGAAPVAKVNPRALVCLPVGAHTSSWVLCCTVYAVGGICHLQSIEARSIENIVERTALAESQDAGCLPVGALADFKEHCCTRIAYDGVCQHIDKREETVCAKVGSKTSSKAECCSGYVDLNGTCQPVPAICVPNFGAVSSTEPCCSAWPVDGICDPFPPTKDRREEDLCVSLGVKTSLQKPCCAQLSDQGGYCQPILGPCLPNGSPQSLYAECCSNFGYFGICLPQPTNNILNLLERNADLAETGCLIAGHHTHSDDHCCSGNAEFGICQPIPKPCAPIGATTGPCCSSFFETGACQPFPPTEFNVSHKNHTVLSRSAPPFQGPPVLPKETRAVSRHQRPCPQGSTDPLCTGLHNVPRDHEDATPPSKGPVLCSVEGGAHTCGASTDIESRMTPSSHPLSPKDPRAIGPCSEGTTGPACGGSHGARDLEKIFCLLDSTTPGCRPSKNPGGITIAHFENFEKISTRATEDICPLDVSGNPDVGCNGAVPIPGHTGGQPVNPNLKQASP